MREKSLIRLATAVVVDSEKRRASIKRTQFTEWNFKTFIMDLTGNDLCNPAHTNTKK
jgi:hypothetical protein